VNPKFIVAINDQLNLLNKDDQLMSIKKAIIEKNNGQEVEKSEYVNLILDDMNIGEICEEDQLFLEGFIETEFLALNNTNLKSVNNLPKLPKLDRLELNDNKIGMSADHPVNLGVLAEKYEKIKILKLSNNQIKTIDEIKTLISCKSLESLDLTNNPVSEIENYQTLVREALPDL
jgi:Leucine-rich repeat (LRR) protein